MADRIQLRRDTAANWTAYNPILLEGESGIELDTDQWKLGDGIHNWNDLPYRGGPYVQQRGQSTTAAMSQKAVTDELNLIAVFDISAYNLTDGQPTKYADLVAALGTNGANVPESYRRGGMTVKYVQSSDDKYIQCRYMLEYANTTDGKRAFGNPVNWQCVDEKPTAASKDFVESGGVENSIYHLTGRFIDHTIFVNGTILGTGVIYLNSNNRIVTPNKIKFKQGDVVQVTTNENFKFYIWKYVDGSASKLQAWTNASANYTMAEDCELAFLVARQDDENLVPSDSPVTIETPSIVDTLQTDVDTLQTDVDTLQTDVDTLQTDVDTLQPDVENLNNSVGDIEYEILGINNEIGEDSDTILFNVGTEETYINATRASTTGEITRYVANRLATTKTVKVAAGSTIRINVASGQNIAVNRFNLDGTYDDLHWVTATTERVISDDCIITVLGRNSDNSDILPEDFACSVVLLVNNNSIKARIEALEDAEQAPATEIDYRYIGDMKTFFHRGSRDICPENTLPAFARCKVLGVSGFETDLAFTSDNVPILIHDMSADYGRVRDSNGNIISGNPSDFTFAQIREFEVGSYKSAKYAGTKIPTLAEACDLIRTLDLEMVIELKFAMTDAQAKIAVDIIDSYGMLKKVIFLKGNSIAPLNQILSNYPYARVLYGIFNTELTNEVLNNILSLRNGKNSVYAYIYNYATITQEKINLLKQNNIRLMWGIVPSSEFTNVDAYISEVMTEAPNNYNEIRSDYYKDMIIE